MMNGDEGGQLSDLIGGDTVLMRGDIRLIGGDPPPQSPPTRENPGLMSAACFQIYAHFIRNLYIMSHIRNRKPQEKMESLDCIKRGGGWGEYSRF